MQKIISLFQRNYEGDRLVRDEVVPGAEWVIAGEGIATQKFDGTACLVQHGKLYKRYDAKRGRKPPVDFIPAQDQPDTVTGHWPGWVPVGDRPEDVYHQEAWNNWIDMTGQPPKDGTYELCGPKIQSNPERLNNRQLLRHGSIVLPDCPRTFVELREYLYQRENMEGVVWHHPDGRMVKIKRKDFIRE